MILVVFHTSGINEKIYIIIMKKKNKKFGTEPGWATAQVSLRLGWALGAGRAGAGRAGTAQAAWAHGRGAHGRWGGRRAGRTGAGAAGALGARALGQQALGRAGRAGSGRHGRAERRRARARSDTAWRAGRAGSWAGPRTVGHSRRADTAWTRRGARQV